MERLVPVFDKRRKMPLSIRLGDVPSLFSEGLETEAPDGPSKPGLTAVTKRIRRLLTSRTTAPARRAN